MTTPKASPFAALPACFRGNAFCCFLLFAIGFLVRMPALQGVPIWDDDYLVTENPFAKSPLLMLEAFRHYLFPDSFSYHYRPVQNISFAFDYLIWNSAACGYHLTNLSLHLGSGVLLFLLLRKLIPNLGGKAKSSAAVSLCAFFIALLWIVHPVHSAAVDYISGRADSLAFLFAAGAWLLFLRARTRTGRVGRCLYYCAACFCGMLALCSREIACVWLALFLLHTFLFEKQLRLRTKLILLAGCLALLGGYIALRHLPERRPSPPSVESWAPSTRAVLMMRALGDYGRLMVYPSTLRMERNVLEPDGYISTPGWRNSVGAEYLSVLGLGVLAALIYGASRKGAGQSIRIFGALWFISAYLPISNIVQLNATVAEHWLYLPSVGFLLFLAGCVLDLPRPAQRLAAVVASLAVCGLGARAYVRSSDWVSAQTFYERTIAAGKSSMRVAVNLGGVYANQGRYAEAEAIFRKILDVLPDYPFARNNLADVLYRQGKRAEAEALSVATKTAATESRKEYPRTWLAAVNLAVMRQMAHDDDGAIAILEQARKDYPEVWQIIRTQAEMLRKTRGPDAALQLVASFAHDHWWHYGARIAHGRLLAEKDEVEAAVEELRFASWLDVHDAEALTLVAAMRLRQNRLDEARAAQVSAVARQPDEPRHYRLLSQILLQMGRNAEAQSALAKLASLQAVARSPLAAN